MGALSAQLLLQFYVDSFDHGLWFSYNPQILCYFFHTSFNLVIFRRFTIKVNR